MIRYDHLLGLQFKYGSQDCYELARLFYRDNFDVTLAPYARPTEFWRHGLNLYMDLFAREGFDLVDARPGEVRPADGLLVCINSSVPNHAGIYVGNGQILHHYYNRLSELSPYDKIWRRPAAVLRHRKVELPSSMATVDLMTLLPDHIRRRFSAETS